MRLYCAFRTKETKKTENYEKRSKRFQEIFHNVTMNQKLKALRKQNGRRFASTSYFVFETEKRIRREALIPQHRPKHRPSSARK